LPLLLECCAEIILKVTKKKKIMQVAHVFILG